jgi:hypothetical protein
MMFDVEALIINCLERFYPEEGFKRADLNLAVCLFKTCLITFTEIHGSAGVLVSSLLHLQVTYKHI